MVVNSLDLHLASLKPLGYFVVFTVKGGDSEFAKFTVPTLRAFLKACSQSVSGKKQELVAHAVGCKKIFFFPCTRNLLVSQEIIEDFFPILHHLSLVILANATVVASVLLCNSGFNFHCYTNHEPTPTQNLAWKWQLRPFVLVWMIMKDFDSCKPASLNCPTDNVLLQHTGKRWNQLGSLQGSDMWAD